MRHRIPIILGSCLLAGTPLFAGEAVAPARDGAVALEEQYQAAVAAAGNWALINFIARDPEAPRAVDARALLLVRPPDAVPGPGPDGEIYLAFDRARAIGTPAAMAAFAAAYPTHPLAIEAARPVWSAPR